MNVLFDDGKRLGRRLHYIDENPSPNRTNLGKFDPNSEAFQFYKPVDSIWGDFETREKEETDFSKEIVWNPNADKRDIILKDSYFTLNLEQNNRAENKSVYENQTQPIRKQILSPSLIYYKEKFYLKDINENIIDLAKLPDDLFNLFENENILGIAFIILKTVRYNPLEHNNRTVETFYHLDVRIVKENNNPLLIEGLGVGDFTPFIIKEISVKELLQIKPKDILDELPAKFPKNDSRVTTTVINPVLVIHKDAISQNRNFTGNWETSIDWDFMGQQPPKRRMVLRLGIRDSRYVLFLHGDKEANDPTGIPST
jgi:hypothetical protein